MTKALVVLSGGQDSTTVLFWAKQQFDEVHAITFDYGQRHRCEIGAAKKVAELAGVASHEVIVVGPLLSGRSPLTDPSTELETYTDYASMDATIGERRELTFVPMRNAFFLTLAANRAEVLGLHDIVTGVCQMDNANYDDCRKTFVAATEDYINKALGHDHRGTPPIKIHTPLIDLSKAESIHFAQTLPGCMEALAYSHTCYAGEYPPCGKCHACVLRAHGFEEAGVPDPLVLRAYGAAASHTLPETANYDEERQKARLGGLLA
jgi:7-cyano-7-deazaguanine synthase